MFGFWIGPWYFGHDESRRQIGWAAVRGPVQSGDPNWLLRFIPDRASVPYPFGADPGIEVGGTSHRALGGRALHLGRLEGALGILEGKGEFSREGLAELLREVIAGLRAEPEEGGNDG